MTHKRKLSRIVGAHLKAGCPSCTQLVASKYRKVSYEHSVSSVLKHFSCVFQHLTGRGCSLLMSRSFTYPSKTDLV